jgi:hypothetical protein
LAVTSSSSTSAIKTLCLNPPPFVVCLVVCVCGWGVW